MRLVAGAVTGLAISCLTAGLSPSDDCLPGDIQCTIENNGGSIGLGGDVPGKPGDPGYGIDPPGESDDYPIVGAGNPGGVPINPITLCNTDEDTFPVIDPLQGVCVPGDDEVAIPYPTLSDLARFVPRPPSLSGEPYTAGVVGKPTNFLSTANEHTLDGALFGYPVSVRFTPVEYTFDYGDGTMATVTDAYDSWAEGGLAQFTPTDAAHVYATKGPFEVSVTVSYSAAVNFWGSDAWLPVDGYVRATAGGYDVTIYEVVTALVDRDCNEDPTGIGCP